MSLDALIILVGAVVALLPFSGFPISWDHAMFFILGLCVIALGVVVRRRLNQKNETVQIPFDAENEDR